MASLFTTMFLVAAVVSPAGGPVPYDADLKCAARVGGDPDMPESVTILDHELLKGNPESHREQINAMQIAWAVIACWEWLEAHYGVKVAAVALSSSPRSGWNRLGETGSPPWKRWSPPRTGIGR